MSTTSRGRVPAVSREHTGRLPRLLAGIDPSGRPLDLVTHERLNGPLPTGAPARLIDEVDRAGLRGRGGADFPTARKLRALASQRVVSAVVVNGSETEPVSRKDAVLLACLPHLVLDGAVLAAQAIGAREAIVRLRERGRRTQETLAVAIAERCDPVPVSVVVGPDGYVGGEETAVINQLSGGPSVPRFVPPRPYQRGYRGRPTLVQNAETLAHVALIARFGARWFRALGTEQDPGTFLTTIAGAVAVPGVYELGFGTPLGGLIDAAGGASEPVQAYLIGGYFGSWIGAEAAHGLRLQRADLARAGLSLGSGVLFALGRSACGLHESARLARYLAGQSTQQCGPCMYGLPAIAEGFAALVDGVADRGERDRVLRWAEEIRGRGACHHPDGTVRLIRSALETFGHELDRHARGRCQAQSAGLPVDPRRERLTR